MNRVAGLKLGVALAVPLLKLIQILGVELVSWVELAVRVGGVRVGAVAVAVSIEDRP